MMEASSNTAVSCKHFVLENIPVTFQADDVIDYVEITLDVDVTEVKIYPPCPGKALVFLKDTLEDFGTAVETIKQAPLSSGQVTMSQTCKGDAIVVNDFDPQVLSEECLQMYFETNFADGESVVKSCDVLQGHGLAFVHFHEEFKDVVHKILETDRHIPLPSEKHSIIVSPFFHNFHNTLQKNIDKENNTVVKLNQGRKNASDLDGEDSDDEDDSDGERTDTDSDDENSDSGETDSDCEHHDSKRNASMIEHRTREEVDLKKGENLKKADGGELLESKEEINQHKVERGLLPLSDSDSSNNGYSSSDESSEADDIMVVKQPKTTILKNSETEESSETEEDDIVEMGKTQDQYDSSDSDDSSDEEEEFFDTGEDLDRNEGNKENGEMAEIRNESHYFDQRRENATSRLHDPDQQSFGLNTRKSEKSAFTGINTASNLGHSSQTPLEVHTHQQTQGYKGANQHYKKSMPITKAQAHFLQPILNTKSEDFIVQFEEATEEATLFGNEDSVNKCYLQILNDQRNIKEKRLKLSTATRSALCTEKGKRFLQSFKDRGSYVFVTEAELVIAATNENAFQSTCSSFEGKINSKETRKSDAEIPNEELKRMKYYLEAELLVSVEWAENQKEICIEGIKDDIIVSMKEIEELINKYSEHEKIFEVFDDKAYFLFKWYEDKIDSILQHVKVLDRIFKKSRVFYKFHGSKEKADIAYQELRHIEKNLTTEQKDLKEILPDTCEQNVIGQFFMSGTLGPVMQAFEISNKCVVSFATLSDTSKVAMHSTQTNKTPAMPTSKSVVHPSSEKDFDVTPTCKMVVKVNGDITRETSDVLVCTLDERVDLRRTGVGRSFNKLLPDLWQKLKLVHKSDRGSAVLTVMGPFEKIKAKAICHAILSRWDPSSSKELLQNAVTSILDQAMKMDANSVSFPPIGLGRMFKFPAPEVSQVILATVKSVLSGKANSSLNKIVLLAPDKELFHELTTEAPKHFTDFSSPNLGATGGVDHANGATEYKGEDDSDTDTDDENPDNNSEEATHVLDQDATDSLKASITCQNNKKLMWEEFTAYIRQHCLFTDYFREDLKPYWPKDSLKRIKQKAKENFVFLQTPDPSNKKKQFILKGKQDSVKEMIHFIWSEFHSISASNPERRIISSRAPKRGTVDFLKHASSCREKCPSYWKVYKSKSFFEKMTGKGKVRKFRKVDRKTRKAIEDVIMKSWDNSHIGLGADARNLKHTGIKIISIQRIENLRLFEPYSLLRKQLFERKHEIGELCTDIGQMTGSRGRVKTSELLEDFMKEELYTEINEHYLFHGTKGGLQDTIANQGLDPKMSNHKSMLGKGIYFAETPTKSDQYSDPKHDRKAIGTPLTLIMARVLLGEVYMLGREHKTVRSHAAEKLSRPPCRECENDKCTDTTHELCDSVMAEKDFLYREFVVYDVHRCYPEYIITYKRV